MHRSIIGYITHTHTHTHPHPHPYPHTHCHTYTATQRSVIESDPLLRHAINHATEPEFRGALLPHQKSTPTTTTPTTKYPISRIWRFQVVFSNEVMRN